MDDDTDSSWWQALNSEAEQWEMEYRMRISTGKHGAQQETPNGLPTTPDMSGNIPNQSTEEKAA